MADDDGAFLEQSRAFLDAHATLRRGESDWSNGPRSHTPDAQREFFDLGADGVRQLDGEGAHGCVGKDAYLFRAIT